MTAPRFDLPVFVINLERDRERRADMQRQLDGAGLRAEFVPAVDGSRLHRSVYDRYDRDKCLRVYGVEMLPAEIGCYLSHYYLAERILSERLGTALILEDDIVFEPGIAAVLQALVNLREVDWKVIRLTTLRPKVEHPVKRKFAGREVARLDDRHRLYRLGTHVLGGGAYLMNREGAKALTEYGRRIFMPIDHTLDRFWENGIAPYVVRPFPVHQRADVGSTIGRRDPRRKSDQPLPQRVARRVQRLKDSFAKRLYNLTA